MTLEQVIDKYFSEGRNKYFHGSDRLHHKEGDTFLRFEIHGDIVDLYFCGDNGEVCILCTNDPIKLNLIIENLIY